MSDAGAIPYGGPETGEGTPTAATGSGAPVSVQGLPSPGGRVTNIAVRDGTSLMAVVDGMQIKVCGCYSDPHDMIYSQACSMALPWIGGGTGRGLDFLRNRLK